MSSCDVAVIGGGIIGTAAAVYLAEAGRSVVLLERATIGAGASGRNSGAIQHPFDGPFATLHHESLTLYRELGDGSDGFRLPDEPSGLLLLSTDASAVQRAAIAIARSTPELHPTAIPPDELTAAEPALAPGLWACRLETAYPVAPAAAVNAFARRAERAGATLRMHAEAAPIVKDGRVSGVILTGGEVIGAEQVLVAGGPWTPDLIPGWHEKLPIRSVWGVVVGTTLASPPRHVLEELGIDRPGPQPDRMFSLVTAPGSSSVGSTFLADEPDVGALASQILQRGATFVPALTGAPVLTTRACARPASIDGRPFIGPISGLDGLFVCAGHGPWGISTGPASALLVARQMLGLSGVRAEFSPDRAGMHGLNRYGSKM